MDQPVPAPTLRDGALVNPDQETLTADVVIIGSGMGGGTLAWALKDTGLDVLIVERGQFLPREPENSQPDHVFIKKRYVTSKPWYDAKTGQPFQPGVYYWVGGQYQDVRRLPPPLPPQRLRERNPSRRHLPGMAIQLRRSRAVSTPRPKNCSRSMAGLGRTRLSRSTPRHTPIRRSAMNRQSNGSPYGSVSRVSIRSTWPTACICRRWPSGAPTPRPTDLPHRPATRATLRIVPSGPLWSHRPCGCCSARTSAGCTPAPTGDTVTAAEAEVGGRTVRIEAKTFVVSGGAVNSAALLLRSVSDQHPSGSGQLLRTPGPQLHGPQQYVLLGREPGPPQRHRLAEDSRPQRLVRGGAGHAVPARQPSDAGQAAGPDDQGRPLLGADVGAENGHRSQPRHLPHYRGPAPAETIGSPSTATRS